MALQFLQKQFPASVLILLIAGGINLYLTSQAVLNTPAVRIDRDGYINSLKVLSSAEIASVASQADCVPPNNKLLEGRAASCLATNPTIHALATSQRVTSIVEDLLGGGAFVIWGAKYIELDTTENTWWHTDIEVASCSSSVNLLISLIKDNSTALKIVQGSHAMGILAQDIGVDSASPSFEARGAQLADYVSERLPNAGIVSPVLVQGEAVAFGGRSWYGFSNEEGSDIFKGILLQYASTDCAIRHPVDPLPPIEFDGDFPPVVLAKGKYSDLSKAEKNRNNFAIFHSNQSAHVYEFIEHDNDVGRLETGKNNKLTSTHVQQYVWEDMEKPFKSFPAWHGSSDMMATFEYHSSMQQPYGAPWPPHSHEDEELFIVHRGTLRCTYFQDLNTTPSVVDVPAGGVFYAPRKVIHSTVGVGLPATAYTPVRWTTTGLGKILRKTGPGSMPAVSAANLKAIQKPTDNFLSVTPAGLTKLEGDVVLIPPAGQAKLSTKGADVWFVVEEGGATLLPEGRKLEKWSMVYAPDGVEVVVASSEDMNDVRIISFQFFT